ncbi:MAG: LysM peptidoglycan-binding domain-containing protein [Candidatus Angelobacter sp.]
MAEDILDLNRVAKCSQMSNPKAGTGSGGDRCTEAVAAMVDATYKIGPDAQAGKDPEALMLDFTEWLNHGSDVSGLEDPAWVAKWVAEHSQDVKLVEVPPDHASIVKAIAAGHMVLLNVQDYRQIRTFDGKVPWPFDLSKADKAGHFFAIVGWRDSWQSSSPTLIALDPLRSLSGMPWDYSEQSIIEAGVNHVWEVEGPSLAKPAPSTPEQTHKIIYGDTLWDLAEHYYGDGSLWTVIAAANGIPPGREKSMFVGAILMIPAR